MLLIYATLFWAGNFTFGKVLVEYFPPATLSLIRWTISFFIFLPFAWDELKSTQQILRKNWKIVIAISLTGVAAFNALTYASMQYTGSINAALMNSFTPVLVALISFIALHEKLAARQWGGISLSFIGVMWIISRGDLQQIFKLSFNAGDLIMGVAVFCWAVYSIIVKKYGGILPQKSSFLVGIGIAVIVLLPFAIAESVNRTEGWHVPPMHWLSVMYVSVFPSVISFICWNRAVIAIGPAKASTFLHLIVLFASMFGVIFLGEKIVLSQVAGAASIISGVYLVTKRSPKEPQGNNMNANNTAVTR